MKNYLTETKSEKILEHKLELLRDKVDTRIHSLIYDIDRYDKQLLDLNEMESNWSEYYDDKEGFLHDLYQTESVINSLNCSLRFVKEIDSIID